MHGLRVRRKAGQANSATKSYVASAKLSLPATSSLTLVAEFLPSFMKHECWVLVESYYQASRL
jgi:hypothetical protein